MTSVPEHHVTTDSSSTVQSFARAIHVLRAFRPGQPGRSIVDVAHASGLSRATTRRLLLTLEELGFVRRADRLFSLTPKVLELGFSHLSAMTMTDVILPQLEMLSLAVGESTSAAILDGIDIVYIARVRSRQIVSMDIDVETRLPAFATAMGRVLLSELSERELEDVLARSSVRPITARTLTDINALRTEIRRTRQRGWALVDQEAMEAGLRSIAAPVYRAGKVAAAINISGSARDGTSAEVLVRLREPLLTAAANLTDSLEHLPT